MSDDVLASLLIRIGLGAVAAVNLVTATHAYRRFHDPRAMVALVTAIGMLGGTLALLASTLRLGFPDWDSVLRAVTSMGVAMFSTSLVFAVGYPRWRR